MILYLDASALVKRYIVEPGSEGVLRKIDEAEAVGTATVSRAEVSAALAKAARFGLVTREKAEAADQEFRQEWLDFVRLPVLEPVLDRAADLAWAWGLRGYDAVQLAVAVSWQEAMEMPVTFASFDQKLWATAGQAGLSLYPEDLPALVESWKQPG